jgi:Flp pilus assembly protein TadG
VRLLIDIMRHLRRADRGAAAVEFAMILPLLILMVVGFAEIGRILQYHHMISKSVNDAAHYLARVSDPTAANAKTVACNLAKSGQVTGTPLLLSFFDPPGACYSDDSTECSNNANRLCITITSIDNSAGTFKGAATLYAVEVTASVPFGPGLWGVIGLGNNLSFLVSHEERHIGS